MSLPHDYQPIAKALGSSTLYEASGLPCAVDRQIRAVWPGAFIAAPAYPLQCAPGDNLGLHLAVAKAPRGSVLVCDTADFVAGCRAMGVTPHVAQNTSNRRSAIDGRTTRHAGYAISLRTRAWIETHFGWLKAAAGMRQVKQRGLTKVEALFQLAMAASNLVRLPKLIAAGAA